MEFERFKFKYTKRGNKYCRLESHKIYKYKQYPYIIKMKERSWMKLKN